MSFQFHLDQIDKAVDFLDKHLNTTVICFDGPMGAGKTTLVSSLCQKWEVTDPVSSPTFSIVNHYQSQIKGKIYHFDFYRLKSVNEALDIGVEEYLDSENYCLIEWGERIKPLLPSDYCIVNIEVNENQLRTLNIVNT